MPIVPTIALNDGISMPRLGMGFWRVEESQAPDIVRESLLAGYRSLDTAAFYGNEAGIGLGVRDAAIPRKELFITSKVWNDSHGYDATKQAFDTSMRKFGLEYLDLYLIHWPVAGSEKYIESWQALVDLRDEGRVRSIGVSNFLERHLRRIIVESGVVPAVNQIEYHPCFKQPELLETCTELDIAAEAWAPLGRGEAMEEPVILSLAEQYGKTPAQIILRWHLDNGLAVIPKTVTPARMRENIDIFDFALTWEEVGRINAIHDNHRIGGDPDTFTGL